MGTSASFALARKITACIIAALLSLALVPASALAEDGRSGAEGSEGAFGSEVPTSPQPPSDPSTEASGSDVILSGAAESGEVEGSDTKPLTLASGLVGAPSSFINSDVALDGEPVIGSFTVDGLTYAVIDESTIELIGVAPSVILSEGSESAGVEESNSNQASGAGLANLALPETITYEGATYTLASISPYAFYLSGVTDVMLPASVSDVDDRAFRSSDVANVTVAEDNQTYSSFDGALYSADKTRLLLIPEGRVGAVLLPREAEVADPGKFSHCSLVDAISVEDGAAFASENGLLYTSDLTTLLRVPAGAEEITIRDGCTTIAAGAMEACANLATINAPASVNSISPDVFRAIPTVSLPAASVTDDGNGGKSGTQLTVLVAFSSADDDLPEAEPENIEVRLAATGCLEVWQNVGLFLQGERAAMDCPVSLNDADLMRASAANPRVYGNGHALIARLKRTTDWSVASSSQIAKDGSMAFSGSSWYINEFGSFVVNTANNNALLVYDIVSGTAGWTVVGWSYTADTKALISQGIWLSTSPNIYPKWQANKYTISFDVNGGKNEANNKPADVTATFDSKLPAINANKPKRDGYTFKGWYDTSAATGGTMYYDASNRAVSGKAWDKAKDTKLYARWAANPYTVEYWNKAGTTKLSSDANFKYDTARNLASEPSSGISTGYSAVGWATAKGQTEKTYEFGSSQKNLATSGTKTLYLAETPNKYTVSFNINGGKDEANSKPADATATFDSALPAINANKPKKDGYTFKGWYDTSAATGGTMYYDASNKAVSGKTWDKAKNTTLYARWAANPYTVEYWNKAGTTKLSSDANFKYDTARNLASEPSSGISTGYSAVGWATAKGQTEKTYEFGSSQKNLATSGTKTLYLAETPNKYTVSFNINGGKDEANSKPADATATFDSALPAINANKPKKDGYTFKGWYDTSAATGGTMYYDASNKAVSGKTWDKAKNTTLYARWAASPYAIAFDTQGGPEVPSISATYDQDVTLPAPGARNGYRFLGWNTRADGSGTTYQAGIALAKPNLATSGTATLFAQWDATISAVVPLEVEAQVDVLGLEAPKEATGCIESRCGEPLKVAEVGLTPLDGAKELFGAGNVSDVFLEVLANNGASPNARFSLGSSATESDASKLQALTMASYGARVPISYRFTMPPEVQTSLVEHADPTPVCSVYYTVALA